MSGELGNRANVLYLVRIGLQGEAIGNPPYESLLSLAKHATDQPKDARTLQSSEPEAIMLSLNGFLFANVSSKLNLHRSRLTNPYPKRPKYDHGKVESAPGVVLFRSKV